MSDETENQVTTDTQPENSADKQEVTKREPVQSKEQIAEKDPAWLFERLERAEKQAQQKLLNDLGFESAEDIKAIVEANRKAAEANLTEQQKLEKRVQELAPLEEQYKAMVETLTTSLSTKLDGLTPEQRKTADAILTNIPTVHGKLASLDTLISGFVTQNTTTQRQAPNTNASEGSQQQTSTTADEAELIQHYKKSRGWADDEIEKYVLEPRRKK